MSDMSGPSDHADPGPSYLCPLGGAAVGLNATVWPSVSPVGGLGGTIGGSMNSFFGNSSMVFGGASGGIGRTHASIVGSLASFTTPGCKSISACMMKSRAKVTAALVVMAETIFVNILLSSGCFPPDAMP